MNFDFCGKQNYNQENIPITKILNKKINDNFVVRIRTYFQFVIPKEILGEEEFYDGVREMSTEIVSGVTIVIRPMSMKEESQRIKNTLKYNYFFGGYPFKALSTIIFN